MQLSIIIVNWNSAKFARECVASIRQFTRNLTYEIIIVDNASTDDSVAMLLELSDIHLICSHTNLGFAGANNLGLARARGRTVLFLNPDTILLTPAINRMHDHLESRPETGAVGCKQLNADLTFQIASVHAFPTIANQFADSDWLRRIMPCSRLWGLNASVVGTGSLPVEVEAVSGACLMAGRTALNQVGGFSTDYFMYGDDIDLCYRIAARGWKIYHLPDARIIHYGGKSSSQSTNDGFEDILTRDSVHTFFLNTKGPAYAYAYRVSTAVSALLRLLLLGFAYLVLPSRRRRTVLVSVKRWMHICKWSAGLERWTKSLPHTGSASVKACDSVTLPDASC